MLSVVIKEVLLWFFLYPVRFCVQMLPLRFTYLTGELGGRVLFLLSREKHKLMKDELERILRGTNYKYKISDIIKRAFINYCLCEIEVLLFPVLDKGFIDRMAKMEGLKHMDAALAEGRGVVLLQAHFGAFQLTMPAMGYSGYKMSQISAPASVWKEMSDSANAPVRRKLMDYKASFEDSLPVSHIHVTTTLKPAFMTLKRNEVLGLTLDGGGGKRLVTVKFLGRLAQFQQGGIEIALRTGAALLPAFIVRERDHRHRLVIHKPLKVDVNKSDDENIRNILEEYTDLLEDYVYNYPCHYTYTLYLKRSRASLDLYPFFMDYQEEVLAHE